METIVCRTPNTALDAVLHLGNELINGSKPAHSDPTTAVTRPRVMPGLGVFWQMVRICYWETRITITLTSIHTNIPAKRNLDTDLLRQ